MRIEIDFENKVVTNVDNANLGDFIKKVKEALPNDWKEYILHGKQTGFIGYPYMPYIQPFYDYTTLPRLEYTLTTYP